jgi:2-keto-3-deoxy-L-rhamnonate aldolase RhmA/quercetin dioxygenase-like cupin family protein
MNTAATGKLRKKLAADEPAIGLWITLEAPTITEIAVALGLDWVVIDAEHGHLDWKEIVEHLRCVARSETVALVRIAELNAGLVKRALDIGADGVVVPWVESAEQLKQAVSFARYPLEGIRGIGAERATAWGTKFVEHTSEANEHVLVVPIIETVKTVAQVPEMLKVGGVELFFFGPADFSSTAGHRGQWEGPGVADQILAIKDTIRRAGKHCGLLATNDENLRQRINQGFRVVGLGVDTGLLIRSLRSGLNVVDLLHEAKPHAERADYTRPPESLRPDRPEIMNSVGEGKKVTIAEQVEFECLVGSHNQARKLTTGLVTFQPGASLPYHTHTFAESITLLSGQMTVEVEGRSYVLGRLDNIAIPAGLAHFAQNDSLDEPAVLHIAMATDAPSRTLLNQSFVRRVMSDTSTGTLGAERVTRFKTANRFAAGPNTEFIDYFNADLLPGFEMSGGFGLFQPGGRLPAHYHDFDESISIIDGQAACIVEGRRYTPSDCATAMVPRGRVHYFVNESDRAISMIWVYAGPLPERVVVDERCATVEGNPWK